jgi:hypothetical protein
MSRLIMVLGMHRSGTSVVARSLECLGAELGARASWSGHDNPDFAEDMDVLATNEMTLHLAGYDWRSRSIDIPRYNMALEHEALLLLRYRLSRYPVWALKEPRLCRLLPFWTPLFREAKCAVSVVEVVRHPLAVAHSLKARNDIPIADGLALWLDHVHCYLRDRNPAWPWVTVEYDRMIDDETLQLPRIARALGLTVHEPIPRYVRDDLRHHTVAGAPLPPEVDVAWQAALERASA